MITRFLPILRALALAGAPLLCSTLVACHPSGSSGNNAADSGAPSASVASPAPSNDPVHLDAILRAEHRRVATDITSDDQSSRNVLIRRAAARALARIGGEPSRQGLLRALSDEDAETIAWAAYGLGFSCKGHEKENVAAIVARALSLFDKPTRAPVVQDAGAPPPSTSLSDEIDPVATMARAIGRCAAEESEPTLVAWLSGPEPRAIAAAYALGDLVSAKQKLREETLAALLNLGAGNALQPPLPESLFPVARLEFVPITVIERLREVAKARLATPSDARLFAIRALGRAGQETVPDVAGVLQQPALYTASERAEAARTLGRLGDRGQRALADVLPSLVPPHDPVALTGLVGEDFGVLLTALETLKAPRTAKKTLQDLASIAAPPNAPAPLLRRLSWLRCTAAKLLAGENFRDPLLIGCDLTAPPTAEKPPRTGSIGARAIVAVLGKSKLAGPRLAAFLEYAKGTEVRAREAALELLAEHDEVPDTAALLAEALGASEQGVVATAAEVITKQPQRAGEDPNAKRKRRGKKKAKTDDDKATGTLPPSPAIVKALLDLVTRPASADDPELLGSVIDAAGALGLKEALPRAKELCASPYPIMREHAKKTLEQLGEKNVVCEAPPGGGELTGEFAQLLTTSTTIAFQTDVGEVKITLDPSIAPAAATRIADLARAGYYNGMVVHRVVPGFVTQLGAPHGDGFGGPAGKLPLRCETSPIGFAPLRVGIALAGRDTGSSQFFVMHARHPHLDGQYALIGTASGPWNAFVDGDIVQSAKVSP